MSMIAPQLGRRSPFLRWVLCFLFSAGLAMPSVPQSAEPASPPPGRIVFLGDSLTAAYGIERESGYVALIQERIRRAGLPFEVVNAGVSGDTSAAGLRRLDWVLKAGAAVLVVELGGNDGLRGLPPASTRTNLQQIVDKTRQKSRSTQILLAGMKMPPNMGVGYAREYEQVFPSLAQSNNIALIPFLLEGVGGVPKLNLPDLIHPTAEGHAKVAETVWTHLEPLLRKAADASKGR